MTPYERALKYITTCDPATAGQGGHSTTFRVAMTLVHGFALSDSEVLAVLQEYNKSCMPPWNEKDLRHKIAQAFKSSPKKERGWMLSTGDHTIKPTAYLPKGTPPPAPVHDYNPEILAKIAEKGRPYLRPYWLSDISPIDPGACTPDIFLRSLYKPEQGEKILCFETNYSQGECLWPDEADKLPLQGTLGAWFLNQPVTGNWVQQENGKKSRRLEACITSWRYLLIESDQASPETWLAALITLPLPIAALYTSGKRSIHTLIRIDAPDKQAFEQIRNKLRPIILTLGGDKQAYKGAQLTRLPYHFRREDLKEIDGKLQRIRHPKPLFQRLLYLNPNPTDRPLMHAPILRNTENIWIQRGIDWIKERRYGDGTASISEGHTILRALRYHRLTAAALDFLDLAPELAADL